MALGLNLPDYLDTRATFRYSDAEWMELVALLPQPNAAATQRRRHVQYTASLIIDGDYSGPPTKGEMMARWQRVKNAVAEFRASLAEVYEDNECEQLVELCSSVHSEASGYVDMYARTNAQRRRNNNPGIAFIVSQLLDLWTESKGSLSYSSGDGETPDGPLIRFLVAASAPIVAAGLEMPGPGPLSYHIRKERDRRAPQSGDESEWV